MGGINTSRIKKYSSPNDLHIDLTVTESSFLIRCIISHIVTLEIFKHVAHCTFVNI